MTLKHIGDQALIKSQAMVLKNALRIEAFSKYALLIDRAKEILLKDLKAIDTDLIQNSKDLNLETSMHRDS